MTEDTTTTDPTITSAATEALAEAQAELTKLEASRERREKDALAGKLDAVDLGNFRDRLDLARAVEAAAGRAVDAEQARMADPETLRVAVAAFRTDPAIGTAEVDASLLALSSAVAAVKEAVGRRDIAVKNWRVRLFDLGIPASGFTIDGEPIYISSNNDAAGIKVGGQGVTATQAASDLIAWAVTGEGQNATASNPSPIRGNDTRGLPVTHAEVRLLRDAGGHAQGTILSTRKGTTLKAMRTLVSYGVAELVSGELPEPSVSDLSAEATREAQADRLDAAAEDRSA